MSNSRLTPQQRRARRDRKAAAAARTREAARPWQRALQRTQELVQEGVLPRACFGIMSALARCHRELGEPVARDILWIGYGALGDPARLEARARSTAEPPVHLGVAEESQISRRWAITCLALLVQHEIVRRWLGGPNRDPRKNAKACSQREGAREEGIGGAGYANGWTVDGIPDPPADDQPPRPPPGPRPPDEPAPNLQLWRAIREREEQRRLERLRRRAGELVRGP